MSTRGAMGESFFRIRLIIVLALAGFIAGFIAGNRIEWVQLEPAQVPVVHQFEIGALLMKLKSCGIRKAPHWIIQRCNTYNELFAAPASRDYLIPRMQRALIWWPLGMAVGVMMLGIAALVLKSARFKKLDEHTARDWFKARKMPMVMDSIAVAVALLGLAAAIYTRRMEWLVLASGGLIALWLELGRPRRKFRHIRGAKIEDAEDVERLIRKQYKRRLGGLEIGGVPVPRDFEVLNFLIAGAPGTGKSTAIAPLILSMRARGDRVFCADARGDYLRRFYRAGDLILNPRDRRSVPWSPLSEIHSESDAAAIAQSLIPPGEGQDASWRQFGQLLLEGVLLHAFREKLTNGEVARLMLVAPLDELRDRLGSSASAGLLPEKTDSQMFHSIRGSASPFVRSLGWLAPQAGAESFSLRRWARDQHGASACWWNYQDSQIAALRTLIATQLDLLALGVLEQPDSRERRTWLIVDELAALGRMSSLEEFLARARKAGGCGLLGVQSLVQLQRLYGPHGASAIISCCSTLLALALGDAESQEYVSKLMGDQEQSVVTRSASQSDAASQQTLQRTLRTERVLMPSELSPGQLKSRHGFLRLPNVPIAPVTLEICEFTDVTPRFVPATPTAHANASASTSASDDAFPLPDEPSTSATPDAPLAADAAVGDPKPPELPPLPPDAAPEDLLQHLEARRQAGWRETQKQDAAGPHQEA